MVELEWFSSSTAFQFASVDVVTLVGEWLGEFLDNILSKLPASVVFIKVLPEIWKDDNVWGGGVSKEPILCCIIKPR